MKTQRREERGEEVVRSSRADRAIALQGTREARPDGARASQGARRELDARIEEGAKASPAPRCASFKEFLRDHARVLQRDGSGGPFSLAGRAPMEVVVDWLDKILRNTIGEGQKAEGRRRKAEGRGGADFSLLPSAFSLSPEAVEIDGVRFEPGQLKGATVAVAGGAQFGKTVLELNLMAYATAIRFLSVGNYLPDRPKVEEIVGQKFRPNVLDLYPWMAEMIQLGKVQNASGKTINRKESYTVTDGERKSFGNFCGMHRPPTSLTLDLALLDEVDDIDERNIGYVDARMTNSQAHLTCFIGTQRAAGAGQNARLEASSFHVKMVPCPKCGAQWCLEEEFPRCVRVRKQAGDRRLETGAPTHSTLWRAAVASDLQPPASSLQPVPDPIITPEMGHDRLARYYAACPECGAELDRDAGRYVARHPERLSQAKLGIRVSQLNISAISIQEIVGAWYAAFEDPSGNALTAFCCDRLAIPNAGVAQPITQAVLDDCRKLGLAETIEAAEPYAMSLGNAEGRRQKAEGPGGPDFSLVPSAFSLSRVAGMDMGPRCWFWCDEVRGPRVSACVWAELIASGNAPVRVPMLMNALGICCILVDAGGEPDLTKRLVLALNGLDDYLPPPISRQALLGSQLSHLGVGVSWDGRQGAWQGIRAAAVLFVPGQARGLEQTVGFTQEGRIYPLIKCSRSESVQTAVNDFLTPAEGVIEMVKDEGKRQKAEGGGSNFSLQPSAFSLLRTLRRARLPQTYIGPGVSQAVLDGHLLNLRRQRNPRTQAEDWIDGVENHLGLAKTYARLAQTLTQANRAPPLGAISSLDGIRLGSTHGVPQFVPGRLGGRR
jgi:predicted RNA-binding Zn-ribbon protein involved in translation (DUF1610 family)